MQCTTSGEWTPPNMVLILRKTLGINGIRCIGPSVEGHETARRPRWRLEDLGLASGAGK